ncbi:hypothetical protein TNCV_1018361 [Trichonephila clavipes]|nr:hypothetical protein TNCV_1018361 [Trichonephila clavipes]
MWPRIFQLILNLMPLFLRTAAETVSMFSAVKEVCGHPWCLSSSTLPLPSLKLRCHSKACIQDTVSQLYTYSKISFVSVKNYPLSALQTRFLSIADN